MSLGKCYKIKEIDDYLQIVLKLQKLRYFILNLGFLGLVSLLFQQRLLLFELPFDFDFFLVLRVFWKIPMFCFGLFFFWRKVSFLVCCVFFFKIFSTWDFRSSTSFCLANFTSSFVFSFKVTFYLVLSQLVSRGLEFASKGILSHFSLFLYRFVGEICSKTTCLSSFSLLFFSKWSLFLGPSLLFGPLCLQTPPLEVSLGI